MVLPDLSSEPNIAEVPDATTPAGLPETESIPTPPENEPITATPQPKTDNNSPQNAVNNTTNVDPAPGKIVDRSSKHKEKITELATPDITTKKADDEENEFIPLVEEAHDTADEQHS